MLPRKRLVVGIGLLVLVGWIGWGFFQEYHLRTLKYRQIIREVREQYPLESLETRLPPPPRVRRKQPLSPAVEEHLRDFERFISNEHATVGREAMLQKLHEGTVEEFVQKEGFGVARMTGSYATSVLANGHRKDDGNWVGRNGTAIAQPGGDLSHTWQEVDLSSEATRNDFPQVFSLHQANVLHFVHANGFGMMKDRRTIAGFQAHQFNALHEEKPWKILRLELVGLLLEEQPRVYMTPTLPRMQDVRGVPTRAPDGFEVAGLEKLHGGEQWFMRKVADGARMLGAIRSVQQCLRCHGGERGDLLGAFSYALRRE